MNKGSKIKDRLNLGISGLWLLYKATFGRLYTKKDVATATKRILLVFQQVYGDSILVSDSLRHYGKLFPKNQGYEISMLIRPSVAAFMRAVLPLSADINLIEVDFTRLIYDFRYYRQMVKDYGDLANTIIVPGSSFSAEFFSAASSAQRRIGLVESVPREKPKLLVWLQKIAYTEIVRPEIGCMMLQRHRILLQHLGLKSASANLPKLLPQPRYIETEKYCVICPGSSAREKCWPIERFAQLSDYLVERYDLEIHLCGGKEEIPYAQSFLKRTYHPERVISHIGSTDFAQWSSIIQNADIVIGNDSATLHLAAAACVPSICIMGLYDRGQFFPYAVDELLETECLPEVSMLDSLPCEYCRTKGYFFGKGNAKCLERIKLGNCADCIDAITVDQVKEKVDILLNTRNDG